MSEKETLLALYRSMLTIRLTEEKIAAIYPSDMIQSPIHLSIGQEAVSAGVCLAMAPEDRIYGTYRGHGIYLAKGGGLKKLFAELYGKDTGCARGKGGSMHLVAPEVGLMGCSAVVASTIPVATGDALASLMQGRKRVIVSFFGDGALEEGVFFESLNFALLKNLPILYVCENNELAIHSKLKDRRTQTELFRVGEGLGLKGSRHDGDDAFAVYQTVSQVLTAIRKGAGPQFLEFITYRRCEHVGPGQDHQESYRDQARLQSALANDPLKRAALELERRFSVSEDELKRMADKIHREIEEAIQFAEESPFPNAGRILQDLFKEKDERSHLRSGA